EGVVEERAEVVDSDEVRRDAETGARVGEAEIDPAHERRDAQDEHRDQRRDEENERLQPRQTDPRVPAAAAANPPRVADGRQADPQVPRTTSRGSTPRLRARRPGCSIRFTSNSAATRARSAAPRSIVVKRG